MDQDEFEAAARPSKSQRKRDMHALQDVGAALVALAPAQLDRIGMSEALRGAVREAQRLTKHEARRRQMQYIGRLMREEDVAPIRAALDALDGLSAAENARLKRLERLRERLLEDEAVLAEIGAAHPLADLKRLSLLRGKALKERAEGRPPRAFRELFRTLREIEYE